MQLLIDTFSEGFSDGRFRAGLKPTDTGLALVGMIYFYFLLEPLTRSGAARDPRRKPTFRKAGPGQAVRWLRDHT